MEGNAVDVETAELSACIYRTIGMVCRVPSLQERMMLSLSYLL